MESRRRFAATLRLTPDAAERLKDWFRETRVMGPSSPADSRVVVHTRFDDEDQALFIVLGFGSQAEAVQPDVLRERVAREVAAMARHELVPA
jgi:predicted DNA-binding transcriptional regulator YafY